MAKTDLEEMVLRMSADINRFEKSMQKAIGVGNQTAGRIEKRFKDMNKGLGSGLNYIGDAVKGAFAVATVEKFAAAVRTAIKSVADIGDKADRLGLTTDQFQQISVAAGLAGIEADAFANGLKKLALNSSEAAAGQGELGKLFKANGVSIVDANGKMLSQTEILKMVADLVKNAASEQDGLNILMTAMGKTGPEAYNLMAQGAEGVARAMGEANAAGVTFTETQIRKAQEYDDQLDILEQKFSVTLKGSLIDFTETTVREFNAIISAAQTLGNALASVMALDGQAIQSAQNVANARSAILQQGTRFGPFNGGTGSQPQQQLTPAPISTDGRGSLPTNIDVETSQLRKTTVIPTPSAAARSGSRSRRTRSGSGSAKGPNDYQRSVESLKEEIAALQAEGAALNANIGTLDGYDAAISKARISAELMADAQRAGVKVTPELKASIDALAGSYATMQQQVDLAKQKHEQFVQSVDDMKNLSKDVLRGFIDDLVAGKSATDALLGGLEKIADKLIDMAVNSLVENAFSGLFGGGGGGFLSGLFGGGGGLYANGGIINRGVKAFATGGIVGSPAYFPMAGGKTGLMGEKGPEAIVPLPDGRTIPVTVKGGTAGSTTVQQTIIINSPTGNSEVMKMVQMGVDKGNRELIARLPQINLERELRAG